MRSSAFVRILAAGVFLLGASSAAAVPLSVDILIDDTYVTTIDQDRLNCVDQQPGVTSLCNASGLLYGIDEYNQMSLDVTNLFLDVDPTVSGNITVTNIDAVTHRYTLVFNLPITDININTLRGGSISGTLTDGIDDGATVSAPSGGSVYTATVNGVALYDLLGDPFSHFIPFGSQGIPGADFGTPIPSLLAGPALNSIGIILDFELTPIDTISFTSEFTVEPVPEPTTGALLGLGLAALAARRRRS